MELSSTILSIDNIHINGDLYQNMLQIRHRLFVKKMGWDLDTAACSGDDIEFDQYDNPYAHYVIVHDQDRKVLGTTRLIKTSVNLKSGWSYMIRDASLGLLSGIPMELTNHAPKEDNIWEATRFAVNSELSITDRNNVLKRVCEAASDFIKTQNGVEILGLMSPFFLRWLPRNGFVVERGGPNIGDPQNPFCVIRYKLAA